MISVVEQVVTSQRNADEELDHSMLHLLTSMLVHCQWRNCLDPRMSKDARSRSRWTPKRTGACDLVLVALQVAVILLNLTFATTLPRCSIQSDLWELYGEVVRSGRKLATNGDLAVSSMKKRQDNNVAAGGEVVAVEGVVRARSLDHDLAKGSKCHLVVL